MFRLIEVGWVEGVDVLEGRVMVLWFIIRVNE